MTGPIDDKITPSHFNPSLLTLAIGTFMIDVAEFAPTRLLPGIATFLGVSIPAAGLLVSAYAMVGLLSAPLIAQSTTRVPRHTLLIALMSIFTVSSLLSAVAGSYATLSVARIITSLNHGAFFGAGSVVAASLVPEEKRAAATSNMFLGLTIATIGGVPLAMWLESTFGWRSAFLGIAVLGMAAILRGGSHFAFGPADKNSNKTSKCACSAAAPNWRTCGDVVRTERPGAIQHTAGCREGLA